MVMERRRWEREAGYLTVITQRDSEWEGARE
jgi:hypothetical protein